MTTLLCGAILTSTWQAGSSETEYHSVTAEDLRGVFNRYFFIIDRFILRAIIMLVESWIKKYHIYHEEDDMLNLITLKEMKHQYGEKELFQMMVTATW